MLILGGLFLVASFFPTPIISEPIFPYDESPTNVRAYVAQQARFYGVSTTVALWIVEKESQFQNRPGDDFQSRGYWQISSVWHPEVSDECAWDLECSTHWALERILDGYAREWSVFKFCKRWWPKECPL